jgi:hypothetical protein
MPRRHPTAGKCRRDREIPEAAGRPEPRNVAPFRPRRGRTAGHPARRRRPGRRGRPETVVMKFREVGTPGMRPPRPSMTRGAVSERPRRPSRRRQAHPPSPCSPSRIRPIPCPGRVPVPPFAHSCALVLVRPRATPLGPDPGSTRPCSASRFPHRQAAAPATARASAAPRSAQRVSGVGHRPERGRRPAGCYRRSCLCLHGMHSVARGKAWSRYLPTGSPQDSQTP